MSGPPDFFAASDMRKKAKETFTHQGVLALVGPNGEMLKVPFELQGDYWTRMGGQPSKHIGPMLESVVVMFLANINDKYRRP